MSLAAGTRVGPYEIRSLLGSGGMGEVYRAHDGRLGRDVAVKLIRSSGSLGGEALRRFEREARATSLINHPNILAVYDTGSHEGAPFVVFELLEGETLRERLGRGALPVRRALEIAAQVAHGLAAAHQRGIVHRDIKPTNLFLTRDGRVKIVDFGIAKLHEGGRPAGEASTSSETLTRAIVGSAGYMAPEQVRGGSIDGRTDLFALGAVLYEMITGCRAFSGDSAVETMNAVLKSEPPPAEASGHRVAPAVEDIIRRCLEKDPEARFHSASDLAFVLEAQAGGTITTGSTTLRIGWARVGRWVPRVGWIALGAAALVTAYLLGRGAAPAPAPRYQPLTFRSGFILSARFTPDSGTVVYGARWDAGPLELFQVRTDNPESRPVGVPPADVLAVTSGGQIGLSLGRRYSRGLFGASGTLATVPLVGGAPRPLLEDVHWADASPDGKSWAVVRVAGGPRRLEYPIGKPLYETTSWVSHVRVSPDGELVGFLDHPAPADDRGSVAIVDRGGRVRRLSGGWLGLSGLAWARDGKELWFSATAPGEDAALRAVDLDGRVRLVVRVVGGITLQDLASGGRALLTQESERMSLSGKLAGDAAERDLSWHDWSLAADVSADGRLCLFTEAGAGGRSAYATYLRRSDATPPVRLGDGLAVALSPDGTWALAIELEERPRLRVLPVGAGSPRYIETPQLEGLYWAAWFPDGVRVLVSGNEPGQPSRLYVIDEEGARLRALGPEGLRILGRPVSPDGSRIVAVNPARELVLVSVSDGQARPVPGLGSGYVPICFGADAETLLVSRAEELPARMLRLSVKTGATEVLRELGPGCEAGLQSVGPVVASADASYYAYSSFHELSRLYLAQGLR